MSRIEAGKADLDMIVRNLAPIIHASIAMVRPTAESKSIRVHLIIPETPLMARCDQRAVIQMLRNLLSNALNFSPDGSLITISAPRIESEATTLAAADRVPG